MEDFRYLADKIETTPFEDAPFPHLYIESFLSDDHFARLTTHNQIKIPRPSSTQQLIDDLLGDGWLVQAFPGCTESVAQYLRCEATNRWPVDRKRLEGFGLAFRLSRYRDALSEELVAYMNSSHFKGALERRFSITRPNRIDSAIHKYLSGYEISPHPDMRSKCLTYLVNINTEGDSERQAIHTHLLKFKDNKRFIATFWAHNRDIDTDWVPWEWCETVKEIRKNNSLVMFAPASDTLHAVKLRYDHLGFQRTQLYGNLWYTDVPFQKPMITYEQFDLAPKPPGRWKSHLTQLGRLLPAKVQHELKRLVKRR